MAKPVVLALAALVAVSGCSPADIAWTEEVKLHDGKVIQLQRRTELSGSGFPVQERGRPVSQELCYAPMGIHWKSHARYTPELFDVVNGKAYAKVSLGDCETCKVHGYPATDALYFAWSGRDWRTIPHEEFPAQLRLNLLLSPKGRTADEDARGLVSLAEKEQREPSVHYSLRVTGARGLNELPSRRGICGKCRSVNVSTQVVPEVFLPHDGKMCGG